MRLVIISSRDAYSFPDVKTYGHVSMGNRDFIIVRTNKGSVDYIAVESIERISELPDES